MTVSKCLNYSELRHFDHLFIVDDIIFKVILNAKDLLGEAELILINTMMRNAEGNSKSDDCIFEYWSGFKIWNSSSRSCQRN